MHCATEVRPVLGPRKRSKRYYDKSIAHATQGLRFVPVRALIDAMCQITQELGYIMRICRTAILSLALASAAGCVSNMEDFTRDQMNAYLGALEGKDEREAFAALGPPTSKESSKTGSTYKWQKTESGTYLAPVSITPPGGSGVNIYRRQSYTLTCEIVMTTDKEGSIRYAFYSGGWIICGEFVARLQRYAKAK